MSSRSSRHQRPPGRTPGAGIEPGYAQRHFPANERRERLCLLVSPDGRDGYVASHQDALLYGTLLDHGRSVWHDLASGRIAYVRVARGSVDVNGEALGNGDGARIDNVAAVHIEGRDEAEVLRFDLP